MAAFTPKLAGFDAEAAMEAQKGSYSTVGHLQAAHSMSVIPELRIWRPGDCIPNCVCVRAEGCPCCGYQEPTLPGSTWPWIGAAP